MSSNIGYNNLYDTFDLSLAAHRLTTGPHKQTCRILVTGQNGMGKSKFALAVGKNIAVYNSLKFYGDDTHHRDYFNEEHIACINPQSIEDLMKKANMKYGVYLIDDASIGWSNRKWMTDLNIWLNNILTTHRVYQNTLIFTLPAERMMDAQARLLFSYYVEMSGPHFFNLGLNFGKIMEITLHPRDKRNPVHTPFLRMGRNEIRMIACMLPDEETDKMYDIVRKKETDLLMASNKSTKTETVKDVPVKEKLFKYLDMSRNMKFDDAKKLIPELSYSTFKNYKSEYNKSTMS